MLHSTYNISVIVPTYNRAQLIQYTLHSLLLQKLDDLRMEVIVVDDGSSDNTRSVVEHFSSLMNIQYHFQADLGYRVASARNVGIVNSSGSVILFVDSGVILGSRTVKAQWDFHRLRNKPVATVGYVYGFQQENESSSTLMGMIDVLNPDLTISRFKKQNLYADIREVAYQRYNDQIEQLPAPWVFYWTCNVSVDRTTVEKIGGFDENFNLRWGVEDQEFGLRIFKSGADICLNREAVGIHYPHFKDALANSLQDLENRKYFHKKHSLLETKLYLTCDDFALNDLLKGVGHPVVMAGGNAIE
jgi:glycosyltransferase involved in cell wall biosynthesis